MKTRETADGEVIFLNQLETGDTPAPLNSDKSEHRRLRDGCPAAPSSAAGKSFYVATPTASILELPSTPSRIAPGDLILFRGLLDGTIQNTERGVLNSVRGS